MNTTFTNKLALITGGTGGLGRAVSLAFLQAGARVVVTYRHQEEMDSLAKEAGAQAAQLSGHVLDVTDETTTQAFVATLGPIDALVNAVGGYIAGKPLWETEAKVLDQMLALNLKSGFVTTRAVLPAMLKQGRGAIVNVAATAAVTHPAASAAYAASKAAAVAMIASLAADLKGTGVRANSIMPSIIDTPANRHAMPDADYAKWPKPEDIAKVVLFLCSDESKLIQGAAIPV